MSNQYEKKRHFEVTPEPPLKKELGREGPLAFVVQKHAARRLHYDLRLELDGVLKSWAIPNGPSLDPKEKRLAVMVEDHPFDYRTFEGVIPAGEYGAGQVIVWDEGTYSPEEGGRLFFDDRQKAEEVMRRGLDEGKVSVFLRGHKLRGSWALVKMHNKEKDWLLIKHHDEFADPQRQVLDEKGSVVSGVTIDDLKVGEAPVPKRATGDEVGELAGARKAPFPSKMSPMLATLIKEAFSDPGWIYEPKLDGYRSIALVRHGGVTLLSRRGNDSSQKFPYFDEALKGQPASELVLDGEIIALDENGKPSFQTLQHHLNLVPESGKAQEGGIPIIYYVFDILYLDGYDLTKVPLRDRKGLLERTLATSERVRLVDHFEGDGKAIFESAIKLGFEGTVSKRKDSIYEPGKRSRSWLKAKSVLSDDFVIGGYNRGVGARGRTFGSILAGYYDNKNRLIYAANVGAGFDEAALENLKKRLEELKTDKMPFAEKPELNGPTIWVRPELVAEVKFAEWTQGGNLRAPVFLRLREDKSPKEVRREEIIPPQASVPQVATATSRAKMSKPPEQAGALHGVLQQLETTKDALLLEVEGHKISLSHLRKELWPATKQHRGYTKLDLLVYLAKVSPYLMPHVKDRPLTLKRYPEGIYGEHFYQKHWSHPLPEFVDTVSIFSEQYGEFQDYLICNNLPALLWLAQIADLEIHVWMSRVAQGPDKVALSRYTGPPDKVANYIADFPDFIIFDLDPYIYSGREAAGAEPELNRKAFAKGCEVARGLKEILDGLSLSAFIKTSGKTGLHVFVPILRQFDYDAVRPAAGAFGRFLREQHPKDVTTEWSVEKRTGKVFFDYNQNARGKTLASIYSPRPSPEASVSIPVRWDELDRIYPTDFNIMNVPERLAKVGDLWAGIFDAKRDVRALLEAKALKA